MRKLQLGEFEEIVMLTVLLLCDNAYGVSIKQEISARLNRQVSVGALQSALSRLEEKGMLKSNDGETNQLRAGRPKRYFRITAYGRKAIEHTKGTRDAYWRDIADVSMNLKNIA